MTKASSDTTPKVTGEELERRWRALGPAVRRELGALVGRLSPGQLVLAGLGLIAAGGAHYLTGGRPSTAADAVTAPAGEPAAPTAGQSPPRAVGEAVLRGIIEGLANSGVLPTGGGPPTPGTGKEADAGKS